LNIPDNPNISWYPSSGEDFRDIFELTGERAANHGVSITPDIFIHTDGYEKVLNEMPEEIIQRDEKSIVRINARHELTLNQEAQVKYSVSDDYYHFSDSAPTEAKIELLDICYYAYNGMVTHEKVLFFCFENNNFLDEIILRFKMSISHLVKIREGLAEGGARMSIVYALDFLSVLGTKYLIYGDIIGGSITNFEFFDLEKMLERKYHLKLLDYKLKKISEVLGWSGFDAGIFKITYLGKRMEIGDFVKHFMKLNPDYFGK
jgi:hypothetical protein